MRQAILFLSGWVLAGAAMAGGIYKSYDKNGDPVYTDTPAQGSESVEPRPLMTIPSLPKQLVKPAAGDNAAKSNKLPSGEPLSYRLTIQHPVTEEMLMRGADKFRVEYTLDPPLWPQHHMETMLDGISLGHDNLSPEIDPQTLDRGPHRLVIQIIGAKDTVMTSASVDFFIQQPSRLNKRGEQQ